ncbi:MAG: PIN domain-containing protein, partial [Candidatus Peregrinibacteria bacterium]
RQVFVDTAALKALMDDKDAAYGRAVEVFYELHDLGVKLVTTDYVIDEFFTLMRCRYKLDPDIIFKFVRGILVSDIQILQITQDAFGDALRIMKRYKDHLFSFTDCVNFVVLSDLKIKDVLTTDKHYEVLGFNRLLK